jgi:hypothetical protein
MTERDIHLKDEKEKGKTVLVFLKGKIKAKYRLPGEVSVERGDTGELLTNDYAHLGDIIKPMPQRSFSGTTPPSLSLGAAEQRVVWRRARLLRLAVPLAQEERSMKTALRETIPRGGVPEEGKGPRAEPPRVGQPTLTKVVTGQRRVGKAWGV